MGYDPHGMLDLFRTLTEAAGKREGPAFLADHPLTTQRIQRTKERINRLGKRDCRPEVPLRSKADQGFRWTDQRRACNTQRWAGTLLILIGITLVARSQVPPAPGLDTQGQRAIPISLGDAPGVQAAAEPLPVPGIHTPPGRRS